MSRKLDFINYVEEKINVEEMPENIALYWEAFKGTEENKPQFTENGKIILKFLREHQETPIWKSRAISEEIFTLSSRAVSGAMRKLVSDGFVSKVGENPSSYELTEKGITVNLD